MDAIKGNINSILNGFKQFTIPVYQRAYNWEIQQCQKLWDDIVHMQKDDRPGHFVGAIVNIAEQAMPTGVQKFMIIDGQQRMTTLSLLLIALRDYSKENPDDKSVNYKSINGMCLINDYAEGEEKYKMLLTHSDKEMLISLIEKNSLNEDAISKLKINYDFFKRKVISGELMPIELLEGIAKLQIVNITLDRTTDDAQLIFESLNSTGMDLSQSDLIRNFLLMGLEPEVQENVFNNYWKVMEKCFDYEKRSYLMDRFFRDYLTFKTGNIPNVNNIYSAFKEYRHSKKDIDIFDFCADIRKSANLYTKITSHKSNDKDLDMIFKNISFLRMAVAYPFLLRVYNDYDLELITKETFIDILKLCESYVFRRSICGIPTNSLNKTFKLAINCINTDDYLNSIKAFFLFQESYKLFPGDEQFREELIIKDVYNTQNRNYLLSKLENHSNKAPINIENYTIEHILPQNKKLSPKWIDDLGNGWEQVQETYLNTIGNLTLTAYNSEMSDKAFTEKLNMDGGFKQSALRINSYVVLQEKWNEEKIVERANILSEKACAIWEYPKISDEILDQYKPKSDEEKKYKIEDYHLLKGDTLELFKKLDKRILNLSSSVSKEHKKNYIAYKVDTNFVDIVPQKTRLRLSLNMKFSDVYDPNSMCKDITNLGRWGNGDVEIMFEDLSQIDNIMSLIEQSYSIQVES